MNTVIIDPHDIEMNLGMETANGGGANSVISSTLDDDDGTTTHDDEEDDTTIGTGSYSDNDKKNNTGTSSHHRALAVGEIKTVKRVKFLVMISLFAITVIVAITAYFVSAKQEQVEFVAQFEEEATKVLQSIGQSMITTFQAADAFTVSIASLAAATNQSWPFVVVPDFAVRAEKIRSLANGVMVNMYPIVESDQRSEWETFTARTGKGWVDESIEAIENFDAINYWPIVWNYTTYDVIHASDEYYKENPGTEGTNSTGPYMPMWQSQPTIAYDPPYNWDLMSNPKTATMDMTAMEAVMVTGKPLVTESYLISYPDDEVRIKEDESTAEWMANYLPESEEPMEPCSDIYFPIISNANEHIEIFDEDGKPKLDDDENSKVVGLFSISVYWRDHIRNILPDGSHGLIAVFKNPCNPSFTYEINGPDVTYVGVGDLHDPQYEHLSFNADMKPTRAQIDGIYSGLPFNEQFCPFSLTIYPSEATEDDHTTMTPIYFSLITIIIFAVTASTFVFYDFWVERRQKVVMKAAITTTKLVSELFPDAVMDQMMIPTSLDDSITNFSDSQPRRLKSYFSDDGAAVVGNNNSDKNNGGQLLPKPIAELFPDTTVFFADISGFTAWSSVREPAAVFTLLETLYGAFDKIAKKYGIFKVETIGDSYVAVCGLPEPNKNHAIAMGRFAFECLKVMKSKTRELEMTLGPGTADLNLRIGLHSGPTIAGVLRGEKARFQLFGDTVNTAARMESNGTPGKIQVSQKTADLIIASGKEAWLTKREELVNAKGKGTLQTFWLSRKNIAVSRGSGYHKSSMSSDIDVSSERDDQVSSLSGTVPIVEAKIQRLIDWNVAIFADLLEEIKAHRAATETRPSNDALVENIAPPRGQHIRDEVAETIDMPSYNAYTAAPNTPSSNTLDSDVTKQLREFITKIAMYYHSDNGFHNFAHASHVIMSTVKLLQRIATPDVKKKDCATEKEYYNSTFGISSDPMTKFAIVFSALIHDVDHQGVTNFQLAKEKDMMAIAYENKSVLEQHSLDLAWSLLTESTFKDLRRSIYATQEEHDRFRQLTINCVMATDIFDKEMKSFRDSRWEKAFNNNNDNNNKDVAVVDYATTEINDDDWKRKATITIECIIQASDVAHTMQHWHVYQRWNQCLFTEMYTAYQQGRSDKDPSLGWYEGELWFFDNYIIPLATKLRECQVFGVSCDEFLDFATENRKEWSVKGRDIVAEMLNNQ